LAHIREIVVFASELTGKSLEAFLGDGSDGASLATGSSWWQTEPEMLRAARMRVDTQYLLRSSGSDDRSILV